MLAALSGASLSTSALLLRIPLSSPMDLSKRTRETTEQLCAAPLPRRLCCGATLDGLTPPPLLVVCRADTSAPLVGYACRLCTCQTHQTRFTSRTLTALFSFSWRSDDNLGGEAGRGYVFPASRNTHLWPLSTHRSSLPPPSLPCRSVCPFAGTRSTPTPNRVPTTTTLLYASRMSFLFLYPIFRAFFAAEGTCSSLSVSKRAVHTAAHSHTPHTSAHACLIA